MTVSHTSNVRTHSDLFGADFNLGTEHPSFSDRTELNAKWVTKIFEAVDVDLLDPAFPFSA